jgi:AcrR family transcriptional regulator
MLVIKESRPLDKLEIYSKLIMNELFIQKDAKMPRTKEANQRIREGQRAKILEGALRAFARKGMAATMSDVAEAAGVSQGLAYRYFASKEALFNELIEQTTQSGLTLLQQVHKMPGTPGERLNFLISKSLESMHEHIEFYRLFAQVFDDETMPEDSMNRLRKYGRTFQEVMRGLIVEAQATGEVVADDPDQLVMVIAACLDGLLGMRNAAQSKKQFPEARILLRILKP